MGMKKQKITENQRHQNFLLSFFDNANEYQIKEVNGFILTKNISGANGQPYVSIFTKESWQKTQQYLLSFKTTDDRQ